MRKKEKVIDSKKYSSIILLILQGENYNQIIAEELKIKPNALIEHLKYLEKHNYLTSEREKKNNKKIYQVNFSQVLGDLLVSKYNEFLKKTKNISEEDKIEIKKRIIRLFENKLLAYNIYSTMKETIPTSSTLKEIFERVWIWLESYDEEAFAMVEKANKDKYSKEKLQELMTAKREMTEDIKNIFKIRQALDLTQVALSLVGMTLPPEIKLHNPKSDLIKLLESKPKKSKKK